MTMFDTSTPWAIEPQQLARIQAIGEQQMQQAAADPHQAGLPGKTAAPTTAYRVSANVAVIDLTGVLTKGYSWLTAIMGGTSMQIAGALIEQAAADPAVKGILLRIDSPGGTVDGTEQLARTIRAATAQKQVLALASGTMASAAYWAGCAADAVYLESSTTGVGSIGVVAKHTDISTLESRVGIKTTEIASGKFKRIASMHAPLTADGRASIQDQLDQIYGLFVQAVASYRGTTAQVVLDKMADGRMFIGAGAINAGLADGFASSAELIQRLSTGQTAPRKMQTERTATMMTLSEIRAAAFKEVGPKGSAAQYQAAIDRLTASQAPQNQQQGQQHVSATKAEQVAQAKAYAAQHGCQFIEAVKALGYGG